MNRNEIVWVGKWVRSWMSWGWEKMLPNILYFKKYYKKKVP